MLSKDTIVRDQWWNENHSCLCSHDYSSEHVYMTISNNSINDQHRSANTGVIYVPVNKIYEFAVSIS